MRSGHLAVSSITDLAAASLAIEDSGLEPDGKGRVRMLAVGADSFSRITYPGFAQLPNAFQGLAHHHHIVDKWKADHLAEEDDTVVFLVPCGRHRQRSLRRAVTTQRSTDNSSAA